MGETPRPPEATEFYPAFFLPVVERGEVFATKENTPAHITILPPIARPYDVRFGDRMRAQLNKHRPFIIQTGAEDWFGRDHEHRVRRVEPELALMGMHALVAKALSDLDLNTDFPDYNPHISMRTSSDIREGEFYMIGGLSVVEKYTDGTRTVVDKVGLKGQR